MVIGDAAAVRQPPVLLVRCRTMYQVPAARVPSTWSLEWELLPIVTAPPGGFVPQLFETGFGLAMIRHRGVSQKPPEMLGILVTVTLAVWAGQAKTRSSP